MPRCTRVLSEHSATCCTPDRTLRLRSGISVVSWRHHEKITSSPSNACFGTWRGTQGHGLHYTKHEEGPPKLIGYSDADMGGDIDDRKSTSGIVFFLSGNLVTWQTAKQRVVALSSCEAEYIAAAAAACQGVWLARLLTHMIETESGAPKLLVDNQSAIALSKNLVFHERSKHINVCYHYIRECVDEGRIIIVYTATEEQLADILTKALERVRFLELRDRISVKAVGDRGQD
jgi:hypothetical protein